MADDSYRSSDAILRESLRDVRLAVRHWRLPVYLAWREIQNRYQRSLLGPLWLTLTLAIRVIALGFIFSTLFDEPAGYYIAWLTTGIVAWEFITGTLQAGCEWFSQRTGYITQGQLTLGSLVIWGMTSQLFMLAHSLPLWFAVLFFHPQAFDFGLLYLPLGIAMLCLVLVPMGLILAMIVPRFRDIGPLVNSALQVAFFITPIMWLPEDEGLTRVVAQWNPFTYLVGWVREPLLGRAISGQDFLLFLAAVLILYPISIAIFIRFRRRLAYWL